MFSLNSFKKITQLVVGSNILCYYSARKTQGADRIFKLNLVHASTIYQIPWIRWIHLISDPFRENSNVNFPFRFPFLRNVLKCVQHKRHTILARKKNAHASSLHSQLAIE